MSFLGGGGWGDSNNYGSARVASGCCPTNDNYRDQNCNGNSISPDKLIFLAEWFDREAGLVRKYMVMYYIVDGTVEIVDVHHNKKFLRRTKVETLRRDDLYKGNIVNIHSRHMNLVEYGDNCTRDYLEPKMERAFLLVKPGAVEYVGFIIQRLEKCFRVIKAKTACMGYEVACKFYENLQGAEMYTDNVNYLTSGPVAAFVVVGENSIERLKSLAGPEDPSEALVQNSNCLRAVYGKTVLHNGFYVSERDTVERDSEFFFPACRQRVACTAPNTAQLCNTTCCIIKPHIVREGLAGRIMADICSANFKITALELFYLDRTHAEEFYEIYKGVLPEYAAMTAELSLGPCYVLELAGCIEETQQAFRSACGPLDPELGRKLRPQSLRARYGIDKIHNALHCTDLPEDAIMELEYFFRILAMRSS